MTKRPVNLYLDSEVYERMTQICKELPGEMSVSTMVNDTLASMLPQMELMYQAFKASGAAGLLDSLDGLTHNAAKELIKVGDMRMEFKDKAKRGDT